MCIKVQEALVQSTFEFKVFSGDLPDNTAGISWHLLWVLPVPGPPLETMVGPILDTVWNLHGRVCKHNHMLWLCFVGNRDPLPLLLLFSH